MPQLCAITGSILDLGLQPSPGLKVVVRSAKQSIARVGDDLVLPGTREIDVPANGQISLSLVSGAYILDAYAQNGDSVANVRFTVPDAPLANLEQLINLPAPQSLDAAQQAVLDAQTARDLANASAAAASTSATAANTAKTVAETARNTATSAATSATASAQAAESARVLADQRAAAALASQQSATASASSAGSSATAAETSKDAAAASATSAASSATAASASATTAQVARDAAISARGDAVSAKADAEAAVIAATTAAVSADTSADAAAVSASQAATAAQNAASSATNAASSATTAASTAASVTASAAAAATSATNAANSASAASASQAAAATSATGAAASAALANDHALAAASAKSDAELAQTAALASATAASSSATAAAVSAQQITDTYNAIEDIFAARDDAEAAVAMAEGSAEAAQMQAQQAAQSALIASTYSVAAGLDTATRNAQAAASRAEGFALSASTAQQQDLSGVTAQALHRSPNAITAMFIYDTSKDSDGGAWTERCQHTSWWNEAINGKWLGAWANEISARVSNASVGPELFPNGSFSDASNLVFTPSPECTLSIVNGRLRVTRIASGYGGASVTISGLTVGKLYRVQIDCINGSLTALHRVRRDVFSAAYYGDNQSAGNVFVSQGTSLLVDLGAAQNSASGFFEYDNISVREVTAINGVAGDYFQFSGDGRFYRLNKNLLINTATLGTQTQLLGPGTYTLSSTTGSSGSVAVSGAATASHTAGGAATTFTVASAGNVTFTVTGSVLTAMCEQGSVATTYEANGASRITEVFRGNKRDFPRLAAIVAEAANVTIYDLTEPGRPMWMRFAPVAPSVYFVSSISAASAILAFGVAGGAANNIGLRLLDFGKDRAGSHGAVATFNGGWSRVLGVRGHGDFGIINWDGTFPLIAGYAVSAIAMTVLPDAPVDPVTGLRVPTIAAATAGGVSVIRHDGVVRNSASTAAATKVAIDALDLIWLTSGGALQASRPGNLGASFAASRTYNNSSGPAILGTPTVVAA